MIVRELRKGPSSSVELILNGNQVGVNIQKGIHGNHRVYGHPSDDAAREDFNKRIAEYRHQGFVETERSLSRHEFLSTKDKPQRFWSIEVEGFWRITFSGQVGSWRRKGREKRFYDRETLEQSCRRLIAARVRAGYRRVNRTPNAT